MAAGGSWTWGKQCPRLSDDEENTGFFSIFFCFGHSCVFNVFLVRNAFDFWYEVWHEVWYEVWQRSAVKSGAETEHKPWKFHASLNLVGWTSATFWPADGPSDTCCWSSKIMMGGFGDGSTPPDFDDHRNRGVPTTTPFRFSSKSWESKFVHFLCIFVRAKIALPIGFKQKNKNFHKKNKK